MDIEAIADVIVETFQETSRPLLERCAALEAWVTELRHRANVPGPQGPAGEPGPIGPAGPAGEKGERGEFETSTLGAFEQRIDRLEAATEVSAGAFKAIQSLSVRVDAIEQAHLSPDAVTKHADELLRKEFAAFTESASPRLVKRVLRDDKGRIERVVEEAIA